MIRVAIVAVALCCLSSPLSLVRAEIPAELGTVDGDIVWVDFWASWCSPCRRSFPWMNTMHDKYRAEGLQIIAVNVDKDRSSATEFLEEIPARFRIYFDPDGSLAERFDVQAMPSSFLLDSNGNVLARHFGFKLANMDEYEQSIKSALQISDNTQ